jgi:hypothetical protein
MGVLQVPGGVLIGRAETAFGDAVEADKVALFGSILMTSAPNSAKKRAQAGAPIKVLMSMTLMPSSGLCVLISIFLPW